MSNSSIRICTEVGENDEYKFVNYAMNPEKANNFGYSYSEVIYIGIFLPLLCLFGIVINSAFLFVVHRVPTMKTITNVYLVNVAVADILFLSSVTAYRVTKLATSPVNIDVSAMGPALCIIFHTAGNIARFSSLGFICAVTWERFCAVCRPYSRRSTNTHAVGVSISIWVVATLISLTMIPAYGRYVLYCILWPDGDKYTDWPETILVMGEIALWAGPYSNIISTFPFFITFSVNVYFYVRIIRGLDTTMMRRYSAGGQLSETDAALRAQTIRMLVVNGVAYFLCLALFQFASLFKTIAFLTKPPPVMTQAQRSAFINVARTLEYLNSVINPIIYTAMSRRYRDAFKEAFRWRAKKNGVKGRTSLNHTNATCSSPLATRDVISKATAMTRMNCDDRCY